MTTKEATAEVFWTAFKALPKREQEAIIARLLGDKDFVEDLMDIARIEQARCEPGHDVSMRDYMATKDG